MLARIMIQKFYNLIYTFHLNLSLISLFISHEQFINNSVKIELNERSNFDYKYILQNEFFNARLPSCNNSHYNPQLILIYHFLYMCIVLYNMCSLIDHLQKNMAAKYPGGPPPPYQGAPPPYHYPMAGVSTVHVPITHKLHTMVL